MIEKLLQHYKNSICIDETPDNAQDYEWYVTDNGKKIGIEKKVLSIKEHELLSLFLKPYHAKIHYVSEEQKLWYDLLYHHGTATSFHNNTCRFIHFQTDEANYDKDDFKEAVNGIFPTDVIILWENDTNGTLIELSDNSQFESLQFEGVIDTFISDFYMTIHLFIGQVQALDETIRNAFKWEQQCFKKARHYLEKQKVYTVQDVYPFLFLEQVPSQARNKLSASILQSLYQDRELLKTIKTFIECNLNVSLAAKKLYMHRNSLQYRIDKFIEKTGIDIKHFSGATATYLSILSHEYFLD